MAILSGTRRFVCRKHETTVLVINGVIPKPRVFSSGARDLLPIGTRRRFVQFLPILRQIIPARIHGLDEIDLLAASPAFDLFFSRNSRSG